MFVGRKKELKALNELLRKKSASLAVVRGRRRIGKSRLAEEFGKSFSRAYFFTGLPPDKGVTDAVERKEFVRQMHEQSIPCISDDDWGNIFFQLASHCKKGKTLVVLDEISWFGRFDSSFQGKLKTTWDRHFKKNPSLILLLSGSDSVWIEENILSSTGFVGRISLRLYLKELAISDCKYFWRSQRDNISPFEMLKVLSVTGGVPRYLEEIQPELSAEQNIYRLCFKSGGLLFHEFNDIFSDLFSSRSSKYRLIVECLAEGSSTMEEIANFLNRKKGGDISKYLGKLCSANFIEREYTWNIATGKHSKLSRYRLADNYLRFYLKHIQPNTQRIQAQSMNQLPPAWSSIMGLQFENLVLSNRLALHNLLRIPPDEIITSAPYFQKNTKAKQGCQMDLLIQTQFNTLYACEIKFRKKPVGKGIIGEVKEKIRRINLQKGFSCRPVLIHACGVSDSVVESEYFSDIIDFGAFLTSG